MTHVITNARIYFDEDTDPANPGWVLAYELNEQECTEALDSIDAGDALLEAAAFLAINREDILLEKSK